MGSRIDQGAHLGINLYLWGHGNQDRVLIECIGPTVHELLCGGLCSTFWFDRYDARGPHLLLVLGVHADRWTAATSLLSSRLYAYLEARPSMEVMHPDELAVRHEVCRGKPLCGVDAEKGLAANNTYRVFEHEANFYPFPLICGVTASDELWTRWSNISLWTLGCVAKGESRLAAARWVATVAHALDTMAGGAEPYWRHHMERLIPGFRTRLRTVGARTVAAEARTTMGAMGGDVLLTAFDEQAVLNEAMPDIDDLMQIVIKGDGCVVERKWPLLYALTHTTLKQLGLGVPCHVPLILAAWLLNYDSRD